MHTRLAVLAILAAAALAACTPMTANAPLFSPADQIGPPPLAEGIWVAIDDDCPRTTATRHGRLPRACEPIEMRRAPDGAWLVHGSSKDQDGQQQELDIRFILAPATERPTPDAYSPLYVAEYVDPESAPAGPRYAAIAPIGTLPAHEIFMLANIDCAQILRDGPIAGLTETHNEQGALTGCVAASQAVVREAARRALIQGLGEIDQQRLVFVRP